MTANDPRIAVAQRPGAWAAPRAVGALILREMATTHGRSALGYLWAVLEPLAGILLLSLVFSMAFHAPSLGRSFPLFYASGLLPFLAYLNLSNRLAGTLRANKQLLFYPRVSFADALIARFVLNGLTELVIAALAVGLICTFLSAEVLVRWPELALGVAMVLALATGIGVLNCFLLSVLPVWERAWSVLNKPLFFLSCVVFIYDQIPEPYRDWLWWNPLVHVVGQVRAGLYATYPAAYVSPGYVFGLSGVALMLGLVFLLRYHRDILNT